ncbi:MAG: hypothetical protein B7Y41_11405 [Hydrogenophilales bacterium 28-61-23]|nr:MAG: hypothetical protein B7Y41_11405 [Hydrogenophilales bacterium 28-61-23]
MLRNVLKLLSLWVLLSVGNVWASDRADEYPGFPRLTDNYEVSSRKQNYDEMKFPIGINKKQSVEGEKTVIVYQYRRAQVNASHLQFQRHFESLMRQLNGEPVFSGKTEDFAFAFTFRFPKNGKTVWALAHTNNARDDVRYYALEIVETGEAWGGAAAAPVAATPQPAPTPAPVVAPAPQAAEKPAVWNGGSWQVVDFDGCDGYDIRFHKNAEPLTEFCDQEMAGKVAVCQVTGCTYKRATPKQCRGGTKPGRMFVCAPN